MMPSTTRVLTGFGAWAMGCSLPALAFGQNAPEDFDPPEQSLPGQVYIESSQNLSMPEPEDPEFDYDIPEDPPLADTDGLRLDVGNFEFEGNTVYSQERLSELIGSYRGKDVSFEDLQKAAQHITDFYRDRGYLLARAYVPEQEVKDGTIRIALLEGRIDDIALDGETRLKPAVAMGYLSSLDRDDAVMRRQDLERALLLINDLPGVTAQSDVKPGEETGTAKLGVNVDDTPLVSAAIDGSNYGTEYSGEYRLGAQINVENAFGYGSRLTFRPMLSEEAGTLYGSIDGSLPIGSDGLRVGAGYSYMESELGEELRELGFQNDVEVIHANMTYPFLRTREDSLYGEVRVEHKTLEQNSDFGLVSDEELDVLDLNLSGDHRDEAGLGGVSSWNASFRQGLTALDDSDQRYNPAEGQFSMVTAQANRLQRIADHTNVFLDVRGQYSPDRLPSSEQMALGGPTGVRAYDTGEALGDSAVIATAELRQQLPLDIPVFDVTEVYGFTDFGYSTRNDVLPSEPEDAYDRSGVGVGLRLGQEGVFNIDVSYAEGIGGDEASDDSDSGQLWVQFVGWFDAM